jgi:hypothetical protein
MARATAVPVKGALEVDVGDLVELDLADLDRGLDDNEAGVVDQHVDAPEGLERPGDEGIDACDAGHVERPGLGTPAAGAARLGGVVGGAEVARTEREVGAGSAQASAMTRPMPLLAPSPSRPCRRDRSRSPWTCSPTAG